MTLSIRRMERDRERKRVRDVLKAQQDEGRVTIGDIAGALLQQAVGPRQDEPAPADAVPEEPSVAADGPEADAKPDPEA